MGWIQQQPLQLLLLPSANGQDTTTTSTTAATSDQDVWNCMMIPGMISDTHQWLKKMMKSTQTDRNNYLGCRPVRTRMQSAIKQRSGT